MRAFSSSSRGRADSERIDDETPDENDAKVRRGGGDAGSGLVEGGVGGGLKCVGIEWNRELVETARSNVRQSHDRVQESVSIQWSDVLDEWNRGGWDKIILGRGGGYYDGNVNQDGDHKKASFIMQGGGDKVILGRGGTYYDGSVNKDSGHERATFIMRGDGELTLLDHATAVLIHSPAEGLENLKPLLREAAARRQHRKGQQLQQQGEGHSHFYTMSDGLDDLGESPKHSCVSDVSDFDATKAPRRSIENIYEEADEWLELDPKPTQLFARAALDNEGGAVVPSENAEILSFRVVTLFSIPGWTPAKVDKSIVDGCTLFLYKDIHKESIL